MTYSGVGFSNIRMPDDRNNLVYKFNYNINTFPEEVFIHEFYIPLSEMQKNIIMKDQNYMIMQHMAIQKTANKV